MIFSLKKLVVHVHPVHPPFRQACLLVSDNIMSPLIFFSESSISEVLNKLTVRVVSNEDCKRKQPPTSRPRP